MSIRLKNLQDEAQVAAKTARDIAEKAGAESRSLTDAEQVDYDQAMAKGRDLIDRIQAVKADEKVLADARALADEIGSPLMKGDISGQDGGIPVRERVKSLGMQVCDSVEFKAMMKGFERDGGYHVPDRAKISSDPIRVKGLFTGTSSTSAGRSLSMSAPILLSRLAARNLRCVIWCRSVRPDRIPSSMLHRPRILMLPRLLPRPPVRLGLRRRLVLVI